MTAGGRREELDARIKAWEQELERLRLALATAPEAAHLAHYPRFVELCRQKELAKSRWEEIRGTYRPTPEADRALEEALAAMEAARASAREIQIEVLPAAPA